MRIIRIPSDSHSGTNLSRSIMFVAARYNTGLRFVVSAIDVNSRIGDGRTIPLANQFSVSVTQKFVSLCTAIAWVSVMTRFSRISNLIFCDVKYSVMSMLGDGTFSDWGGLSFNSDGSESNVRSVNVGMDVNSGATSGISMSKSDGIGSVSD